MQKQNTALNTKQRMNKTPGAKNTNCPKYNAQKENRQCKTQDINIYTIQYIHTIYNIYKTKHVEPKNIVRKAKHKIGSVQIARQNA